MMQGGATLQFSSIPLNMLGSGSGKADYLVTGQWGEKAHKDGCAGRMATHLEFWRMSWGYMLN